MYNEAIAQAMKKARIDSGRSQAYMADKLSVSKKTIQNWEDYYSSPSVSNLLLWFEALNIQPLPYILDIIYPDNIVAPTSDDKAIEDTLIEIVKDLPIGLKRKLLYILHANHGSSPSAVIEMATAHLHAPLRDRLNIAMGILNNYEISQAQGTDVQPEHIQPELEVFKAAIYNARNSICNQHNSYSIGGLNEDRETSIRFIPGEKNNK